MRFLAFVFFIFSNLMAYAGQQALGTASIKVAIIEDRLSSKVLKQISLFSRTAKIPVDIAKIPPEELLEELQKQTNGSLKYDAFFMDEPWIRHLQPILLKGDAWLPSIRFKANLCESDVGVPVTGNILLLTYRKDLLNEKGGPSEIQTVEEMIAFAQEHYDPPNRYGFLLAASLEQAVLSEASWFLNYYGVKLSRGELIPQKPRLIKALASYRKLAGYGPSHPLSEREKTNMYSSGRAAMMLYWPSLLAKKPY